MEIRDEEGESTSIKGCVNKRRRVREGTYIEDCGNKEKKRMRKKANVNGSYVRGAEPHKNQQYLKCMLRERSMYYMNILISKCEEGKERCQQGTQTYVSDSK